VYSSSHRSLVGKMLVWKWITVAFSHKRIKIKFFYFLKIIFDISKSIDGLKTLKKILI